MCTNYNLNIRPRLTRLYPKDCLENRVNFSAFINAKGLGNAIMTLTHFHISDRGYVALEAGEHRDQGEHTRDEESNSSGYSVQSKPEAEPGEGHDESRRSERLDEMMPDLSLEPEEDDQAGKVTCGMSRA